MEPVTVYVFKSQVKLSASCQPFTRSEFDDLVVHLQVLNITPGQLLVDNIVHLVFGHDLFVFLLLCSLVQTFMSPLVDEDDDFRWISGCPCVTAIGGPTSMARLPTLLLLNDPGYTSSSGEEGVYTREDVEIAISRLLGKTDNDIAAMAAFLPKDAETIGTFGELMLEPHLATGKLALLKATMEHLGIERVKYQAAIGSCAGVLVHPRFFTTSVVPE